MIGAVLNTMAPCQQKNYLKRLEYGVSKTEKVIGYKDTCLGAWAKLS